MSKAEFDAFVKHQQTDTKNTAEFDAKQQLDEWLWYLDALHKQINDYLKTYLENGTAVIKLKEIKLNEESIGGYGATELILTIGRSTLTFKPIGTLLIGAKGRVDVQGPYGKGRLILINKKISNARQLITVKVQSEGDPISSSSSKQVPELIEWVWKISTPPPQMSIADLTQDSFFDMILALANG